MLSCGRVVNTLHVTPANPVVHVHAPSDEASWVANKRLLEDDPDEKLDDAEKAEATKQYDKELRDQEHRLQMLKEQEIKAQELTSQQAGAAKNTRQHISPQVQLLQRLRLQAVMPRKQPRQVRHGAGAVAATTPDDPADPGATAPATSADAAGRPSSAAPRQTPKPRAPRGGSPIPGALPMSMFASLAKSSVANSPNAGASMTQEGLLRAMGLSVPATTTLGMSADSHDLSAVTTARGQVQNASDLSATVYGSTPSSAETPPRSSPTSTADNDSMTQPTSTSLLKAADDAIASKALGRGTLRKIAPRPPTDSLPLTTTRKAGSSATAGGASVSRTGVGLPRAVPAVASLRATTSRSVGNSTSTASEAVEKGNDIARTTVG